MRRFGCVVVCGAVASASFGQTLLGPTPYFSTADSPFAGRTGFAYADMEGGVFSLPGAIGSAGGPFGPGGNTDSVDGDDGSIDGLGQAGWSWFSGSGAVGVTFTFDPVAIGFTPTNVGIVWTDGSGPITFEAFDTAGNSLGTVSGNHADNTFGGTTVDDRFYGISYAGGVGSIHLSNTGGGIELDHVQYALPTPGVVGTVALAGLAGLRRRR